MLQEHNLLPQNHSKKKLKKICKGGQIYSTKNVCPRNIPMNLKIATTPFHHQLYIIQKQLCEALLHSFSGLVLYFGFQHFVFYSAESRTGSGGTKRTSSAGSTGRGGKQENRQIMSNVSSMIQRVIKCCVISTILLQIESNR